MISKFYNSLRKVGELSKDVFETIKRKPLETALVLTSALMIGCSDPKRNIDPRINSILDSGVLQLRRSFTSGNYYSVGDDMKFPFLVKDSVFVVINYVDYGANGVRRGDGDEFNVLISVKRTAEELEKLPDISYYLDKYKDDYFNTDDYYFKPYFFRDDDFNGLVDSTSVISNSALFRYTRTRVRSDDNSLSKIDYDSLYNLVLDITSQKISCLKP